MRLALVLVLAALHTAPAAAQQVDARVASMAMRDFGQLGLFVRASVLRDAKARAVDRLEFDACMIAVASDPRTWSLTVGQAIERCLVFAARGENRR